jgi:uncharacterized protein YgbK (DUF1537 family)
MGTQGKDYDLQQLADRQAYIRHTQAHLIALEGHQDEWILFARRSGASHAEIGRALGVSKQAIAQRIARIERDKPSDQ